MQLQTQTGHVGESLGFLATASQTENSAGRTPHPHTSQRTTEKARVDPPGFQQHLPVLGAQRPGRSPRDFSVSRALNHIHCCSVHNSRKPETARSLSTAEWIKKTLYNLYRGMLFSYLKNHEICKQMMELEKNRLGEITETQKHKYGIYQCIFGC